MDWWVYDLKVRGGRLGIKGLTLLRSVSVNLAELRRAPGAGGGRGFLILDFECFPAVAGSRRRGRFWIGGGRPHGAGNKSFSILTYACIKQLDV